MATTLQKDRLHVYDELALFVQVDGKLTDAVSVEYQVFDESAGYPGTAIAPGLTRIDVTSLGNYATGCYGVYDPGTLLPWLPDSAIARGRIVWYFTIATGGDEQIVERPFEVVESTVMRGSARNLALIADITVPAGVTDRTIFQSLRLWTSRVERYCREQFYPSRETKRFRWLPGRHLMLPRQLFGLTSMTPVDDAALTMTDLLVSGAVNGLAGNPKIELKTVGKVFGASKTWANVAGVWGHIDPATMATPEDLLAETITLVTQALSTEGLPAFYVSQVRREKTDAHEVEYSESLQLSIRSALLALFGSVAFRDQLDLYRAPRGMGFTGTP